MDRETTTINVLPGSELAHVLDEAALHPVVLERNGERYRLHHEAHDGNPLWHDYDPDGVKDAVAATLGTWADLDTDTLIAELYRAREEGTRPPDRP